MIEYFDIKAYFKALPKLSNDAIGTEILMGQIADTDAQYLSRRLQSLGISVYHHQAVGDNPQRMRDALALALSLARRTSCGNTGQLRSSCGTQHGWMDTIASFA